MIGSSATLRAAPLLLALGLLTGCHGGLTQLVLVIDSNLHVPDELAAIQVRVEGSSDGPQMRQTQGTLVLPVTMGLVDDASQPPQITISVTGTRVNPLSHTSMPVISREVITSFVPDATRMLEVYLPESCAGQTCPGGQTCTPSGCASANVDPQSLPPWSGHVDRLDASRPAVDGGTIQGGAVLQVAAGAAFACARDDTGAVYCWGDNGHGALGGGATASSAIPVKVQSIDHATWITAGGSHACAVIQGGAARCWGQNDSGQLGNGSTSGGDQGPVDVNLSGSQLQTIVAGTNHTCALTTDGRALCWGDNSSGQVGQMGTYENPTPVSGLGTVTAVAAGGDHSCAILASGAVECWGDDLYGQLGDGMSGTGVQSVMPVSVGSVSGATEISCGDSHTCAVTGSGVSCWGWNQSGQAQPTAPSMTADPAMALSGSEIAWVAGGQSHTCAVLMDGSVECWGDNSSQQLGSGSTTVHGPLSVPGVTGAIQVEAGTGFACAVTAPPQSAVFCWGNNGSGRLGNGMMTGNSSPMKVMNLGG